MRKVIIVLFLLILPLTSYPRDKIKAILFHSSHCKVCFEVKKDILPPIKRKYKDKLDWQYLNTHDSDNLSRLKAASEQFGKKQALVPAILVGNNFLVGAIEIKARLEEIIDEAINKRTRFIDFGKVDLVNVFKKLSVFTVIGSGLIDGINPCAFAVIVFFISFLALYGYKRREIICVGIFYCLAVFSTYLLIGLGLFKFFYSFSQAYLFIKGFYYFVSSFCFLMGVLALYDYFKFRKTGSSKDTILQLPQFLKKRINAVIGSGLREKKQRGLLSLAVTSFVIGFFVSLLEAVCTGQMYVPIIVFILKNTDLKIKAAAYLFLYNFMFILPLIVVFLLSLAGVSSSKFNNFLKKNVGKIKIIMALVFFLLGSLIFYLK